MVAGEFGKKSSSGKPHLGCDPAEIGNPADRPESGSCHSAVPEARCKGVVATKARILLTIPVPASPPLPCVLRPPADLDLIVSISLSFSVYSRFCLVPNREYLFRFTKVPKGNSGVNNDSLEMIPDARTAEKTSKVGPIQAEAKRYSRRRGQQAQQARDARRWALERQFHLSNERLGRSARGPFFM